MVFVAVDDQRTMKESTSVLPTMNLEWLCPTKSCFGSPVRTHKNTHVMTQYLDIMHTLIYHCRLQRNVLNLSIMVLYVRKYEKKMHFDEL